MKVARSSIRTIFFYCFSILFFIIASSCLHLSSNITALYNPLNTATRSVAPSATLPSTHKLPQIPVVLTLHYKTWYDAPLVLHNCIQAKSVGARMVVYTEHLESQYCSMCVCILFIPTNCKPPNPELNARNHCEKLSFMSRMIPKYKEFIYLDADLLVMHPGKLFHGMASRALTTDFLATYAEGASKEPAKYNNYFNSGMMFIRYIPGLNYDEMMESMYKFRSGFDQSILSGFIHKHYANWDTLSWKWHCRAIIRFKNDVPPSKCLTIHDRGEVHVLLKLLNKTMKSK